MKKQRGLVRNRFEALQQCRQQKLKKVHRFKNVGKFDTDEALKENFQNSSSLLSTNQSQSDLDSSSPLKTIYDSITSKLQRVEDIQKQMSNYSKARLKSFKQQLTKDLDKKIAVLAIEATENIIKAEKEYQQLKNTEPSNYQQQKQISLGLEIRQLTKTLRHQERQYFDKIKIYEEGSNNKEIQLTETQRHKMKDWEDQQIDQQIDRQRDEEINKLVVSINGLTKIYKQMANLVYQQGTIIDRIDYNIDKAMDHTQKGVQHLRKAQKHTSSACADRCIQILVGIIIVFAVILGFKYSY